MLAFVIFPVLGATFLIGLVLYFYLDKASATSTKKRTSIPGLDPRDENDGNLKDIDNAGSFHEFISSLHERYGNIVSYWHGDQLTVSTCTPELFKPQIDLVDKPDILFEEYVPLMTRDSILYTHGPVGQERRRHFDRAFSYDACKEYYKIFIQYTNVLIEEWKLIPVGQHISLHDGVLKIPVKSVARVCFGKIFKDDDEAKKFFKSYDLAMHVLPSKMWNKGLGKASEEAKLEAALSNIHISVRRWLEEFRIEHSKSGDATKGAGLLDQLINGSCSDDVIFADAVTIFVGGSHTVSYSTTWAVFQLASNPDVQLKLRQELLANLTDEVPTLDEIKGLKYLSMVIDETLRWVRVGPYTARVSSSDLVLEGHTIPKGTPIVQSLGTCLHSKDIWNEPEKFNPENFSDENRKKRHPLAFQPFGFAGKRKCPGYRFALIEIATILAMIFRKFEVEVVPGQNILPNFGLVATPGSGIWVTIKEIK